MTIAAAKPVMLRPSWTCRGCDVLFRRRNGGMIPEPRGWVDSTCLACQREAMRDEGGNEALLRVELLRGTPLLEAARLAQVSQAVARARRTALIAAGEIEAPTAKPRTPRTAKPRSAINGLSPAQAERRNVIDAALEADPDRHDSDIAEEAGCAETTIARRRRALRIRRPPRRQYPRRASMNRDLTTLRKLGTATTRAFATETGLSQAAAGKRLANLVSEGLATVEGIGTKGSPRKFRPV